MAVDPILESALKRLDALRQQILQLQQEAEKMQEFVETAKRLAEDSTPPTLPLPLDDTSLSGEKPARMDDRVQKSASLRPLETKPFRSVRVRTNPAPARVMEEVVKILRASSGPMTRSQLLLALADRGLEIGGHDPAKVLGTNIWRYMNKTGAIIQSGEGYRLAEADR